MLNKLYCFYHYNISCFKKFALKIHKVYTGYYLSNTLCLKLCYMRKVMKLNGYKNRLKLHIS